MDTNKAAIAIVFWGDLVLVGERSGGDLVFPGGFIKCGEKGYQAAAREAEEETGMRAEMEQFHLNSDWNSSRLFYMGEYLGIGDRKNTWELKSVRWMRIEDALNKLSYSSNRHYLKKAVRIRELKSGRGGHRFSTVSIVDQNGWCYET